MGFSSRFTGYSLVRGFWATVRRICIGALFAFSPLVIADELYSFTSTATGRGISVLNTDTNVVSFNLSDLYAAKTRSRT